jgi:hypothetical protein
MVDPLSCGGFCGSAKKKLHFHLMSRHTLNEQIPETTAPGFTFSKEINIEPIAGEGLVFLKIIVA